MNRETEKQRNKENGNIFKFLNVKRIRRVFRRLLIVIKNNKKKI